MRKAAQGIEDLIDAIYEAAGAGPELWPHVSSRLADLAKSAHAALFIWNHRENSSLVSAPSGRMDPKANALYEQHYGAMDEAVPLLARKHAGDFLFCQQRFDDLVRRSEFYNDFLMPIGGVRYRAAARLVEDERASVLLETSSYRLEPSSTTA